MERECYWLVTGLLDKTLGFLFTFRFVYVCLILVWIMSVEREFLFGLLGCFFFFRYKDGVGCVLK